MKSKKSLGCPDRIIQLVDIFSVVQISIVILAILVNWKKNAAKLLMIVYSVESYIFQCWNLWSSTFPLFHWNSSQGLLKRVSLNFLTINVCVKKLYFSLVSFVRVGTIWWCSWFWKANFNQTSSEVRTENAVEKEICRHL